MSTHASELRRSEAVVIIPMYNERENAAAIIDAVLALEAPFDVLVVDDNSPDGTAAIVREKMDASPGSDSARHISRVFAAPWTWGMNISARWMPISLIIRPIFSGCCDERARMPIWWSDRAMFRASMWLTGLWDGC